MRNPSTNGFTLIELAVVIVVLGILAATAIPRYMDATALAEASNIRDFKTKLTSAAVFYIHENGRPPRGFNEFVTNTPTVLPPHFVSTHALGSTQPCRSIQANSITCNNFQKWTVTYRWQNETVTGEVNPKANNAEIAFTF
jgi:prepilin-type N-terminal cleavage/methylation domain-containing protein